MHVLAEHHIPIILVAGDDDHVVPYKENGEILEENYRKQGEILEVHLKRMPTIIHTAWKILK